MEYYAAAVKIKKKKKIKRKKEKEDKEEKKNVLHAMVWKYLLVEGQE